MFGSFFEEDRLLNWFISGVYTKRWPKCARISVQQQMWPKIWSMIFFLTGLISEKTKVLYTEINKRAEAATVILEQAILYSIFILCLCQRIIGTSNQDAQFMNCPSQIFFNDINYGYGAAILKKNSLQLLPFYMGCYLFLLWKYAQNDAHCNCIKPP